MNSTTIYEFIKAKQLEYLKAKLVALREEYSEKDLRQIKDQIFNIEYEDKFEVLGYQECLKEKVKSTELMKGCNIIFNDKFIYNPIKNTISKITPNEGNDLITGFKKYK